NGNLLSERKLMSYAKTGYKGTNHFEKIMDEGYKLIFLDDLGRGSDLIQDKRQNMWDVLTDYIYSEDDILIMTSNYDMESKVVSENFTAPAMDRLQLLTVGRKIKFDGENFRPKLAKEHLKP